MDLLVIKIIHLLLTRLSHISEKRSRDLIDKKICECVCVMG